jgi:WD40 repeat protein
VAELADSMGRIRSRISGLAGWLVVLAAMGGVGLFAVAQSEPGKRESEEEGPVTEVVRGDHDGPVWSLAFASGDAYLASATITGDVRIKDLETGESCLVMNGPVGSSKSLAFSPDGRTLAVAGWGAEVRQWAMDTGTELEPLAVGGTADKSVAFSPDGSLMAVGDLRADRPGRGLTLVDRASGRSYVLDGHPGGVKAIAFMPDSRTLAAGDPRGLVKLVDPATGQARATLRVSKPDLQSLVFSPDGSRLATTVAQVGHVIQFWDTATAEPRGEIALEDTVVFAFAFSRDGKTMAVADSDGFATLWDVGECRQLGSVGNHGRPLYAVAFSSDGKQIATGGAEGNVALWDVSEFTARPRHTGASVGLHGPAATGG